MMPAPTLPPLETPRRAERVRARLEEASCEALVVTDLADVRWLTGFTGSNAVLAVRPDDLVLITDGRYRDQAADQLAAAGVDAELVVTRAVDEALRFALAGVSRIGLQADDVSWDAQRRWADVLRGDLVPTTGLVLGLRATKDAGEVARLEHAAAIADAALGEVRSLLHERPTERDVARALESAMLDRGADGPSFETIVASGPNGARPHARPSRRVIGASAEPELVVVDFGARYDGYHSDMTRTFVVGDPTDTQQRMFDVVRSAQSEGVAAVRDGTACVDVDATCRRVIAEAGWGDAFVHGTGHGIGLVIHEEPRLSPESRAVLRAGHCVTVEPGVYLTDHGGVRIEDSVVVTGSGCRAITRAPYDPVP